jgi:hypothetical protein
MSFDIVILKPTDPSTDDLLAIESVMDIGSPTSVSASLEFVFPGCTHGAFSVGEAYSVESAQSGDPVTSIHLTLRYGSGCTESTNDEFLALLSNLCQLLQSQAFAVSHNSRIAPHL